MLDGIPVALANGLGVGALLVILFLMLASGRLFTKRQYDDKEHEATEWRAESRIKDQQILELTEQNTKMLNAFGPTLTDFLRGLRRAGVEARDGEETDG